VSVSFGGGAEHASRREHRAERNFNAIDTDHNGELSQDELKAAQQKRQAAGHATPFIDRLLKNFSSADTDGSGGISFSEAHPNQAAAGQAPAAPASTQNGGQGGEQNQK
jgi:hypothetical protein